MVEYKYEDCVSLIDCVLSSATAYVRAFFLQRERERERERESTTRKVKTKKSSDCCVVATVREVSGTRPGILLAQTRLTGSSVERGSGHSMIERLHTLKGSGTHNMHGPVHLSSVDEQNRNTLLGKSDLENMDSKDNKLQSNGQSSSDNSSLLNNTSLGSDSSYQSVEEKNAQGSCTDQDVIDSTRDVKTLNPRHEDIGSHDDTISCVSGVDKAEDHVERENGLNGATSADMTPLMDKMVDNLVDESNSSESPLLNDRSPKVNGSLIDVEGTKDLDIKEGSEKLCAPLEQNCNDASPLPSQLVDTKVASAATIEDEVRVCDICGDLGREYMLAICSKCSDGAEHIYCMRVPMDKVPEGDWLCEDCEVKQESKIQNQFKADNSKETLMRSSSIKDKMPKPQSLVSSTILKKPASFERRKPSTSVSPNTNNVSLLRKRSLEVSAESPKGSSPKRRLVKPFLQNGLLKSKSFNVNDLKLKDRLSRQDRLKSPIMTKDACVKKFQKSRSFNNVDTSTSDMEKAKKMVIGARQTIEPISTNKISALKPGFSKLDKKATSHGKMVLPTSKASPRDREGPQSCRLPSSPLARKGSIKTEPFPNKPKVLDSCESNPQIHIPRVLSISSQETVIPRIDRDWRGSFEVSTGGGPCTRIQAHCSSRASDNVLDLVRKLPTKILLEELPRGHVSPTQFTEDSIAMFFFAEDLKSYGDYKNILKRMMDNEFALRGHIDGAELLVFSSSILPPSSQRWNNLLFLWGLFRRRPVDVPDSSVECSNPCLSLQPGKTEPCLPKTAPHKNSDQMVRASEIVKQEKLKLSPVSGRSHLCRSTGESPVSLKLFPEAGQLCSLSKVSEPQFLDPKPVKARGYENQDYEINEERSNKRMKSFGAPGGFHFADFGSDISLGPPLAAIDECEGVDLELSLGTVQKRDTSRSRDDEVGPVSLSLSLGLPFS